MTRIKNGAPVPLLSTLKGFAKALTFRTGVHAEAFKYVTYGYKKSTV